MVYLKGTMKKYNIIQLMAQEQIKLSFKKFGIEGTEQKIKEIYKTMPKILDTMLKEYYKIINQKN